MTDAKANTTDAERHDWTVTGMDCASCASKIRTVVERLPGVSDVSVALMAESLTLKLAPGQSAEPIEAAVKRLGYGIGPKGYAPRKRGFVLPVAQTEDHDHGDHDGHDHGDRAGHDPFGPSDTAAVKPSVTDPSASGHGAPGPAHGTDPTDRDTHCIRLARVGW